jgi:hypothetical protein
MTIKALAIRCYSQIRLVMTVITTRIAGKKAGFFKSFREAVPSRMRLNIFEKQPLSKLYKSCPNCAAQLPLGALLCGACDYNFIASIASHRYKLLNAPTISGAVDRVSVSKVRYFQRKVGPGKSGGPYLEQEHSASYSQTGRHR